MQSTVLARGGWPPMSLALVSDACYWTACTTWAGRSGDSWTVFAPVFLRLEQ